MAKTKEQKIAEAEARRAAKAVLEKRSDLLALPSMADTPAPELGPNEGQETGDGRTVEEQSLPSPPGVAIGPVDGEPDPRTVAAHVLPAAEQAAEDAKADDLTPKQTDKAIAKASRAADKAIAKASRAAAKEVMDDAKAEVAEAKEAEKAPATPYRGGIAVGPLAAEVEAAKPAYEQTVRYPNIAVGPIPDQE